MRRFFSMFVAAAAAQYSATVSFDPNVPKHIIEPAARGWFLAYNIDIGSLYNNFDFTNVKLQNMVRQMGPTVIRIGGTADDYGFYIPNASSPQGPAAPTGHYTYISNQIWRDIIGFFANTGNTLLWDLDAQQFRDEHNNWDPTGNASAFLAYTQEINNNSAVEIWWSIGNEPEAWPKVKVDGTQLAKDALILKDFLRGYGQGDVVYGPSFADLNVVEGPVYINGTLGQVNGLTVHHYPITGHCNVPDALNRTFVDRMYAPLNTLYQAKLQANAQGLIMNLEETGGSSGGGCENITDRYASGFWYLHALGVTAEAGFDRVHRQDIAGWSFTGGMSHYQLIGQPGWTNGSSLLTPHPDYFTSIMFKMLVAGTAVLNVSVTGTEPSVISQLSVHLWCGTQQAGGKGSIVLMYLNPTASDISIDLGSTPVTPRTEYILTSSASEYEQFRGRVDRGEYLSVPPAHLRDPPATIQADAIFLNGAQLTVTDEGLLPVFPFPGVQGSGGITVPPFAYGFIAFPSAAVPACAM